ncbi:hypothetical protein CONLIGDRAFT_641405 [Coniochaeta ligniaria NRRL 30616]|uniref:BTB domain-containing protein n=1 Tax=Coniochaeta ligniaria NRRL 30616 TaxID=1408157 RepID=A0A1J7IVU7_9PEZI|nr:hypothetical protein CONLIGDRAFT_641405 [Coniochaeta ligniaria NRRL 30616]
MSSTHDGKVLPMMEDSNVGPGANGPSHSTTPAASPTLSFVTAIKDPDDLANLEKMSIAFILNPTQVGDETIGPANNIDHAMPDGDDIVQPEGGAADGPVPDDQVNPDVMNISHILNVVQVEDAPAAGPAAHEGPAVIGLDANAQPEGNADGGPAVIGLDAIPQREGNANDDSDGGSVFDLMEVSPHGSEAGILIPDQGDYAQDEELPDYDDVPGHNNIHRGVELPIVYTIDGRRANLTTPIDHFRTLADYKLMCLGAPKITLVFQEVEGEIKVECSRKLLRDFSRTFEDIDRTVGDDILNVTGLFANMTVKSAANTFIQLLELMQAGGFPVPVSGDMSFMTMVELGTMAEALLMPTIRNLVGTYMRAKIQELRANWMRDYELARTVQNDPYVHLPVGPFVNDRRSPIQQQEHKLLDIQEAYENIRFNERVAKVVVPNELARLVGTSCPNELILRVQAAKRLHPGFLATCQIYGLEGRAQARRLEEARRDEARREYAAMAEAREAWMRDNPVQHH